MYAFFSSSSKLSLPAVEPEEFLQCRKDLADKSQQRQVDPLHSG
jgi:hypothetical protein